MMSSLFMQTCDSRYHSSAYTADSIVGSDAVGFVWVATHPPNTSAQLFYLDCLRSALATGASIIVRLEDDIEVNRHLLHNIETWPALQDPNFGMGFLSNALNWTPPFAVDANGSFVARRAEVSAALGQVWRAAFLAEFIAAVERHPDHLAAVAHNRINYDNVMSKVCVELGRNVHVHFPALVRETEHGRMHSTWGNNASDRHPPQPDFSLEWRREQRIPKIIHQIWIGDFAPPRRLMDSWRDMNPGWDYRLWTDPTGWRNQRAIDANDAMHAKADVMRYEILAEHGGFYVDADSECIAPLPDWLLENEAFSCWESESARPGIVANGYMACRPGAAVAVEMCEEVAGVSWPSKLPVWRSIGSGLWSRVLERHPEVRVYPSRMFIPWHFTGRDNAGECPVFARQFWGSTLGYGELETRGQVASVTGSKPIYMPGRGQPPFQTFSAVVPSVEERARAVARAGRQPMGRAFVFGPKRHPSG